MDLSQRAMLNLFQTPQYIKKAIRWSTRKVVFLVNDISRRRLVPFLKRLVAVSLENVRAHLSSFISRLRVKWRRLLIPKRRSSLHDNGVRPTFCGFHASFGLRLIRESLSPQAIKRPYNRGKNIVRYHRDTRLVLYTGCPQDIGFYSGIIGEYNGVDKEETLHLYEYLYKSFSKVLIF